MEHFDPKFINDMLDRYSNMSEAELFEEAKRLKEASGKREITEEDKNRLFQFVEPLLSEEEMEQLKNLLKSFE